MFDFVRTHTRLFQGLLVLLIFPSFVFFGVQGYSSLTERIQRQGGARSTAGHHAASNGTPPTSATSNGCASRCRTSTRSLLDTPQMRRETLDGLVRERVLLAAADKLHLCASDDRLQRAVRQPTRSSPRCATPTAASTAICWSAQGMTLGDVRAAAAPGPGDAPGAAGRRRHGGGAEGAASTAALDALLQRREVQLQRFEPAAYRAKVKPTDADIEAFYKANEAQFQAPEQARIEYVVLDLDALKQGRQRPRGRPAHATTPRTQRATPRAEERRASHILIKADKDMPAAERATGQGQGRGAAGRAAQEPGVVRRVARKNSQRPGLAPSRAATSTSSAAARWSSPSRTRRSR